MVAATGRLAKPVVMRRPKTITSFALFAHWLILAKLQDLLKDTEAESLVLKKLEKTACQSKPCSMTMLKSMRFLPDAKSGR